MLKYIEDLLQGAEVEWKPLGEVCGFITGFPFRSALFKEEGLPICKTTNLRDGRIAFDNMVCFNLEDYEQDLTRYLIFPGDIVIGMSGSIKVGINDTDRICYLNQRVGKFAPNTELLNNKYLYYFLCGNVEKLLGELGGGAVKNLSNREVNCFPIPLPPLSVQAEIVRILDKFTSLEAELEAELDCRKRQYEHYRNQLLSFENTTGGGTNNVIWKPLGEVASVGTGSSNRQDEDEYGQYPFYVRSKNVLRSSSYQFDETAIVIPGEGGIGDIFHYVEGKYALHQRAYRIAVKETSLLSKFLYHYLISHFKKYIVSKSVGATALSIRKPMIESFPIPLPPLSEQERIVGILDRFEALAHSMSEGLPREIALRRQQYEHYRHELLDFARPQS